MLYRVNKNWPNHFNKHDMISFLIKDLRLSNATETINSLQQMKPSKICERNILAAVLV